MTIHVVALLFATLTLGVSSPRVSLHRWLLFTIRAQGKDGEEDLNKLSVINSNSCRNTVFFVIIIETFDFSFIIRYKDFHFYCSKTKFSFYLAFLDFLSEFSSGETFLLDLNCIFFSCDLPYYYNYSHFVAKWQDSGLDGHENFITLLHSLHRGVARFRSC